MHPRGLATGTLAMPGRFAELVVRASPAPALKLPMAPCCHQSKSHPLSDVWVLSCLFLSILSTLPLRGSQAILPRIPVFLLQSSIHSLHRGPCPHCLVTVTRTPSLTLSFPRGLCTSNTRDLHLLFYVKFCLHCMSLMPGSHNLPLFAVKVS